MEQTVTLEKYISGMPERLRSAAVQSFIEVIDGRARKFESALEQGMPVGTRKYRFPNVHTYTKVATHERIADTSKYGYRYLYNGAGYKFVNWNTKTGGALYAPQKNHAVPFDLIANVNNFGRKEKWVNMPGGQKKHIGRIERPTMSDKRFIDIAIHNELRNIDPEIYMRFEQLMNESEELL